MSIQIGTLVVEMSANVARLQEDMNRAANVVGKATKEMGHAFETVKTAFEAIVAGEGIKMLVESGVRAEQAANRLTAAFKMQGDQVGFTRNELDDLAESLAHATQFDDKDFKRGEAELLKFGNIYGDVFGRAMTLSADLAAFNGTNVVAATQALGKALANPTQGVKGLGAEIGKLLPAQTDMIKNLVESGRGLDAQNLILDIVQQKLGGTADLMNTGYTKAIGDATKAWDHFKESLAGLPVLKGLVVGTLEGIATTLGLFSGMAQNSAEPLFGKRIAMYREMLTLQEQIAQAEKSGGHADLTFTDDSGRVMGEDLRADELKKKLAAIRKEYDAMYILPPESKGGDTKLGPTPEQIAFGKSLDKQLAAVGMQGPLGGMLASADELHMGGDDKTIEKIFSVAGALNKEAQSVEEAKRAWAAYKAIRNFEEDLGQQTKDLEMQTKFIGATTLQQMLLTDEQKRTNEVRRLSINMSEEERAELERVAEVVGNKYTAALRANYEEQRKWRTGFQGAMNTAVENSTNAAAQINGLFTNAFRGMEDALVNFTKTGKLDFRSLADSIITDLIRIRIQQSVTTPLAQALNSPGATNVVGSILGAMGIGNTGSTATGSVNFSDANYIQPKAAGGPIDAGTPYWVGEQGPELVVPRSNGTVIPNGGAGAQVSIVNHYHVDARSDIATVMQVAENSRRQAVADVEHSLSRGGRLAKLVGMAKS